MPSPTLFEKEPEVDVILYSTSFYDQSRALLDEASRDALARIRADRDRAPAKIKPLLAYIESHLYDPQLNVNRMKAECNVRDNSLTLVFHAKLDAAPKSYISQRRLETAAQLLRDTQLRLWQIAELVGYSCLSVFGTAFDRWAGERPSTYRRRLHSAAQLPLKGAVGVKVDDEFLKEAVAGKLPEAHACALIRRLLEIYRPAAVRKARMDDD